MIQADRTTLRRLYLQSRDAGLDWGAGRVEKQASPELGGSVKLDFTICHERQKWRLCLPIALLRLISRR